MFNINVKGYDLRFKFIHMHDEKKNKHSVTCIATDRSDSTVYAISTSWCSPKDTFDKNKGRKVALTRLLDYSGFNREERTKIWNAYFAARGKNF